MESPGAARGASRRRGRENSPRGHALARRGGRAAAAAARGRRRASDTHRLSPTRSCASHDFEPRCARANARTSGDPGGRATESLVVTLPARRARPRGAATARRSGSVSPLLPDRGVGPRGRHRALRAPSRTEVYGWNLILLHTESDVFSIAHDVWFEVGSGNGAAGPRRRQLAKSSRTLRLGSPSERSRSDVHHWCREKANSKNEIPKY